MRFITPYHRGVRIQHGRGLGNIFSALFRVLKPLASKGISMAYNAGKSAIAHPEIQSAMKDIQTSAINSGVAAINKALKPKTPTVPKVAKAKGKKRAGEPINVKPGEKKKKKKATVKKKKKKKKVIGSKIF